MKTGSLNTAAREVTGSVQAKHGYLYISLNLYIDGKRKPKMINTGLPEKGYRKREANELLKTAKRMLNTESATIEEVMDVVEGAQFKQKRIPTVKKAQKKAIPFIRQSLLAEMVSLPPFKQSGNDRRISDRPTGYRGDSIQVAAYFRQWMNRHERYIEEDTMEAYRSHVDLRIIPYFDLFDIFLTELKNYDVRGFYDYCEVAGRLDGKPGVVSSTTVHRVHSVVHKALNDAVKDGLMEYNPAASVTKPPNNVYNPEYYTEAETNAFLEAAKGDLCEIPLTLAFIYGIRRSEALGLKESALDFESEIILIRHKVVPVTGGVVKKDILKSKKSLRALPMYPEVKMYLKMVLDRNRELRELFGPKWNPDGYICVKEDGELMRPDTVSSHYKDVARKAGTKINRLHDARHTNASLQVKKGVNMRHLMGWLGHSDIKTTEKYTHFDVTDLKPSAKVISQALTLNLKYEE